QAVAFNTEGIEIIPALLFCKIGINHRWHIFTGKGYGVLTEFFRQKVKDEPLLMVVGRHLEAGMGFVQQLLPVVPAERKKGVFVNAMALGAMLDQDVSQGCRGQLDERTGSAITLRRS